MPQDDGTSLIGFFPDIFELVEDSLPSVKTFNWVGENCIRGHDFSNDHY